MLPWRHLAQRDVMRRRVRQHARIGAGPAFREQLAELAAGARLLLQQPLGLRDQCVPVHSLGAVAEVPAELGGVQRVEQRAPVQAVARADEMHGVAHQVQPDHLTLVGQG
jgi:hypothetical protein